MRTLAIDIETFSPVDLTKSGIYPYAEHPDFEILLFAYAFDDDPVKCIDLKQGETLPPEVAGALTDPDIVKTAFNAAFERTCLRNYFNVEIPPEQWECTLIKCGMCGLPMSLQLAAEMLNLEQKKMSEGKSLIRYFAVPCKPTKANGRRTRNLPEHAPDKWETFREYCIRDVEAERAIRNKLSNVNAPEREAELIRLDAEINDRGVRVDLAFVHNAIRVDDARHRKLLKDAVALTGLPNPNSVAQLKDWICEETGDEPESLSKDALPEIIANTDSKVVKKVLELRKQLSKSSTKKYAAIANTARRDTRVGGLLQFYGANRTGRWAGRLVQIHNLPQNHIPDLDLARRVVKSEFPETLELLYDNPSDVLSQLIRTAFIPKDGHKFVIADFSAIEARVLAWLAGEQWRLDVFASHGKIYEASAAKMFDVPIEAVTKGSELRQRGKIAELALGYQGGVAALKAMGADKSGLSEEQMQDVVNGWRKANPKIVEFWKALDLNAESVINCRNSLNVGRLIISTMRFGNILHVELPTGRNLYYPFPQIGENRFGGKNITYTGMNQTTKKWERIETYGGKLAENVTQAVARDCLAEAMLKIAAKGYDIVMHVHDEIVVEVPEDRAEAALKDVCEAMSQTPDWATGLPLKAEGFTAEYYKKQ